MPLLPRSRDDGAIFMAERDQLAEHGVRWTRAVVFDVQRHHASASIAKHLSRPLES